MEKPRRIVSAVVVLVACVLLLPGCFIRNMRMDSRMKAWMGQDIRAAVSEYGPPSQVFQNGPTRVVSWHQAGPTVVTGNMYSNRHGSNGQAVAVPTSCNFWFDVEESGKIVGWHWKGRC